MLNIGGVLGICDSVNPDKGKPFDCRVLGCVLQFPFLGERIGVPAGPAPPARPRTHCSTPTASRWWRSRAPAWRPARPRPPARSSAACAIAASRWMHSRPPAFRCGGTSSPWRTPARGARMIFTDLGIVTTHGRLGTGAHAHDADGDDRGPARRRRVRTRRRHPRRPTASRRSCATPDIRRALSAVVLSANDPVAAWGGVKLLRERFGIEPCAVTGPATDNAVGVKHHRAADGREALNAMTDRRGARRRRHRAASASVRKPRADGVANDRTHPRDRARRHRLRGRRAAAPGGRASVPRRCAACRLGQPAGRTGSAVLPPSAARAAAPAVRQARRAARVHHGQPADGACSRRRRTGVGRADRPAAVRGRAGRHAGRASWTSPPTSAYRDAEAFASGVQARARRAGAARRSSPARCPST